MRKNKIYILLLLVLINAYMIYGLLTTNNNSELIQLENKVISVISKDKIDYKKVCLKLKRLYNLNYIIDYPTNRILQESAVFKVKNISNVVTILLNNKIDIKSIKITKKTKYLVHFKIISNIKEQ